MCNAFYCDKVRSTARYLAAVSVTFLFLYNCPADDLDTRSILISRQ